MIFSPSMNISVVIPLFNKANSIMPAINSVLSQTFKPRELIVVNDGSNDGSEILVENIENPIVKLIHQANQGVSVARNVGISEAKGDWIAFLDADDLWMPDFLESIAKLHFQFPEAEVLATAYEFLYANGTKSNISLNKLPFEGDSGYLTNYFHVAASSHPPICSSAVAVKKSSLDHVNGFPVGLKSGEDLITWAKLFLDFQVAYSRKVGALYIHQPANSGISFSREQKHDPVGESLLAIKEKVNDPDKIKGLNLYIGRWLKSKSMILLEIGENRLARKKILEAFSFSDEKLKLMALLLISLFPVKISKFILKK